MIIENTQIRNHDNNDDAYHFKVINVNNEEQVYLSRKTILDRPCWKDDQVVLNSE